VFSKLPIYENKIGFPNISEFDCQLLICAIEYDWITGEKIREWIADRLLTLGRECYEEHITLGTYPDHTRSPQALAFAIAKSAFSEKEIEQIKFDHGDTAQSFYLGSERNLIAQVWKSAVSQLGNYPLNLYTSHGLYTHVIEEAETSTSDQPSLPI